MSQVVSAVLALVFLGTAGSGAWAENVATKMTETHPLEPEITVSYLWDGGALPFILGSGAVALGVRLFAVPAATPRLFPASEGGRVDFRNSVPKVLLAGYAVGAAGLIAAVPNRARWHHLKGYGEAVITTVALTEIAKNLIGRHRPHFQEGMPDNYDQRRSFFSGHASVTAASTVYLGLYLSRNLLPSPSAFKTGSLLILGGVLVGVPYSRLADGRHHLSDVLAGAVVGSAVATLFYTYQESRFGDWLEERLGARRYRMQLVPNLRNPGFSLSARF